MNLSNESVGGEFLVVSQFTLCADLSKGKRPGFEGAMRPPGSERLYLRFCERLGALTGRPVKTGRFGASMVVSLRNDGPATFWLEA
jgi:D-tyrosyl-tRNA(Tyr) deacylase